MAKKTVFVSDLSGKEIPDGKGATISIKFSDARKGQYVLDVLDDEAEELGRKGRKQGSERSEAEDGERLSGQREFVRLGLDHVGRQGITTVAIGRGRRTCGYPMKEAIDGGGIGDSEAS